jgi:methyltransferase-like protein
MNTITNALANTRLCLIIGVTQYDKIRSISHSFLRYIEHGRSFKITVTERIKAFAQYYIKSNFIHTINMGSNAMQSNGH